MPIRFHCKRCHQLLGIASRKAGTEIACPKCGLPQEVPSEEAAAAATAMDKFAVPQEEVEGASGVVVYDDEPAPIDVPRRRGMEQPAAAAPSTPPPTGPETAGRPIPRGKILYSRRTLYVQGMLFLLLAAVAFGSGYYIGRGDASFELQVAHEEAAKEQVLMDGRLVYHPTTGQIAGDENAVLIALPAEKLPESTLSIRGLRPQDPPPPESDPNVRKIAELGGIYARADASGAFSVVFPEQGKYYILLVSRHTARPEDDLIDELDLDQMKEYFLRADDLVSRYKYRWTLAEINVGSDPIEHDFGRDGEEDTPT